MIECDAFDPKSIELMIHKTLNVVTTAGPYAKFEIL